MEKRRFCVTLLNVGQLSRRDFPQGKWGVVDILKCALVWCLLWIYCGNFLLCICVYIWLYMCLCTYKYNSYCLYIYMFCVALLLLILDNFSTARLLRVYTHDWSGTVFNALFATTNVEVFSWNPMGSCRYFSRFGENQNHGAGKPLPKTTKTGHS